MNSSQISQILTKNPYTKTKFLACTACDQIPFGKKFPYLVVVNTDTARNTGRHWVLIFVESVKKAEYFDSFGQAPNPQISQYLQNFEKVFYSKQCVQKDWSEACGIFCILYAIQRCRGQKPQKIVSSLKQLNPLFIENFLY